MFVKDFTFCRRWRSIGGKIHIDKKAVLTHYGVHGFGGSVSEITSVKDDKKGYSGIQIVV